MKERNILFGQIKEKYYKAQSRNIICQTDFLDMGQKSEAINFLKSEKIKGVFFGGYEDAERCRLYFLPEEKQWNFAELQREFQEKPELSSVVVLRVSHGKTIKKLSHRDYLGALMGLGIKREKVGDILVHEDGADILIDKDIAEYTLENFNSAGRTKLIGKLLSITEIVVEGKKTETIHTTVASMRLDGVLAQVFDISRGKAVEAIRSGIVFVNDIQAAQSDMKIDENFKLVIRGKGKVIIKEIKGQTRKGRIALIVEKYI